MDILDRINFKSATILRPRPGDTLLFSMDGIKSDYELFKCREMLEKAIHSYYGDNINVILSSKNIDCNIIRKE